jgi:hypothetical protein
MWQLLWMEMEDGHVSVTSTEFLVISRELTLYGKLLKPQPNCR